MRERKNRKKETCEKLSTIMQPCIKGRIASNSTWNATQEIRTFDRQTKRHDDRLYRLIPLLQNLVERSSIYRSSRLLFFDVIS